MAHQHVARLAVCWTESGSITRYSKLVRSNRFTPMLNQMCMRWDSQGERTRRHNEKEFPYFADIPVPDWGGFGGGALRCITQWHTWNGAPEKPGVGSRRHDRDYARWCFADAATAKKFADMLGGEVSELGTGR